MSDRIRSASALLAATCSIAILTTAVGPRQRATLRAATAGPAVEHRAPRDDGRVATVVDRQGTALVRPVGRDRWTPLRQRALLMPGDLVRTSVRGANALEAGFAGGGVLIVGPGTLVELTGKQAVELHRGEVSVRAAPGGKAPIRVTGPGGFDRQVGDALIARVDGGKTGVVADPPRWLKGYRDSTTDDWVGSLIAKVDGRDVPLSVGYHRVDAVIRDQIAQTTVEQSFINSTDQRLEGVFYFPLPADASISGFGMWIGRELVEADIVEKQRARQIYEDILRRKKDPGLLEWSGGNLFKARVFPIEAHAEKRIRIRYTQVLPVEGATVRYRYALRSELLRKRPLRSLGIKVSVSSATRLADAASPTHEVRVRRTDHAATLEYDAQEVTPEKDFEAAITLDQPAPLTLVPHRRGDDGYFMLQLTPPGSGAGPWQRELMPDGDPVDLILVADTSASMHVAARQSQADFIRSLLSMLGAKDRFRLMTADIDVRNYTSDPVAVTEAGIAGAMAFLAERTSLGWTDLDRILERVGALAKPGTVVVYVGDGIGTTGDADPVALARRLRELGKGCRGVVHAVSCTSTYEQVVLQALASLGGGSVRKVGEDPAAAAYGLLAEAARPAVKDLRVTFDGLRTARVYPEAPPNLPVGHQQVILGRFLPTGEAVQTGRAVVTGTLAGQPVRYSTPIRIAAAESGNSFVPRLWARRHVDHLLEQGRSAAVREDIVAFSSEFGIMTPYTSLLVLESDEDRERYGVERRVKMRDGEKFFAAGRDAATTEILRQQMRAARTYRLQLRLRMLAEIADLGRSLHGWAVAVGESEQNGAAPRDAGRGGPMLGGRLRSLHAEPGTVTGGADRYGDAGAWDGKAMDFDVEVDADESAQEGLADDQKGFADREIELLDRPEPAAESLAIESRTKKVAGRYAPSRAAKLPYRSGYRGGRLPPAPPRHDFSYFGFPRLEAPVPASGDLARARWSQEILDLVASLDRRPRVAAATVGFRLTAQLQHLHEVQGRITGFGRTVGFHAATEWALHTSGSSAQPTWSWVHGGRRGVIAAGMALGRERDAVASDGDFRFPLLDYSTRDLARSYVGFAAALKTLGDAQVELTLTAPAPSTRQMVLLIDRERRVVTRFTVLDEGRATMTTTLSDFVEKGGMSWATRIENRDDKGRVTWRQILTVDTGTKQDITAAVQATAERRAAAIMIAGEDPRLDASRQAIHRGAAGVAEHLRMVVHHAATQQWDKAWADFDAAIARVGAGAARAVPMLRLRLQAASRRGEELKASVAKIVAAITAGLAEPPPGLDFQVAQLRQLAAPITSKVEQLTLLESLEPVFHRPAGAGALELAEQRLRDIHYRTDLAGFLEGAGRIDEALRLRAETGARYPDHQDLVMAHVQALGRAGDRLAQTAVLAAALARKDRWTEVETGAYYDAWLDALYHLRDLPAMTEVAREWTGRVPDDWRSYHAWLASLMFRDRQGEVTPWVRAELAKAAADDRGLARLRAAARHALGQGWNMGTHAIDRSFEELLTGLVRRCVQAGDAKHLQLAGEVVASYQFRRTDGFAELRRGFLADLLAGDAIARMPLPKLAFAMQWIEWGRNRIDRADWEKVRDALQARFAAAQDAGTRQAVARHVLQVLDAWQEIEAALAFLRGWLAAENMNPEHVARDLFTRLLGQKWTPAVEEEVFGLVARLQPEKADAAQRESLAAAAIRQLCDGLLASRIGATLAPTVGAVEALEKLPRAERRQRERAARISARQGLAARLALAADAADDVGRPWFRIEQLCFAAEAGADRGGSVTAAAELLAAIPAAAGDGAEEPVLRRVLRERCALVMAYAATRRDAAATVADGVLGRFDAQIAAEEKTVDWRYQVFRLMVALERNDALAARLRQWITPADADATWRRSLGYLLAEQGDLAAAATAFEGVEAADQLGPADYAALASWHLVLGDDRRRAEAGRRRWQVSDERALRNRLYQVNNRVARRGGGLPGAIEPEEFEVMRALFGKATRPHDLTWQVQSIYRSTKDFRVLGCLPYAVVGHTSGSVYPFLSGFARIVAEVHEEATCDELAGAIQAIAGEAKRAVDRRGLLLMRSQVERRAAEVLNAPGDHVERAVAAMRAAAKGEWERGERLHMARFLSSLGKIPHDALAGEQLRQLRELLGGAAVEEGERLGVAAEYARTLWYYAKQDAAIDALGSALDEHRTRWKGVLPQDANNAVAQLVTYLNGRQHYHRGERFLIAERERQTRQTQKHWYTQQLDSLYLDCLARGGEVGLGRDEALYLAHRAQLLERMWKGTTETLDSAFNTFLRLHATAAKQGRLPRGRADLLAFAKETMPELSGRFLFDQAGRINALAGTLRNVADPAAALEVLIAALEREPGWLRTIHREYWRSFHWNLARFRQEAADPALDRRLLPIAKRELLADLERGNWRGTTLIHKGQRYFWAGAAGDFAAVAKQFIDDRSESVTAVSFAANYLWDGLAERDAAIAALEKLHGAGRLPENGQWQLSGWYVFVRDYAAARPLLAALIEKRPDRLDYRVRSIEASYKGGDPAAARELMLATAQRWQEKQWWNEGSMASLASAAFDSRNFAEAAKWYEEAVRANERGGQRRWDWRQTRSGYYGFLAQAHAALGNTAAAVDAAAAAVVTWGDDRSNRQGALQSLHRVLSRIADLDGYVATWDAKVKASGLDAPLIRKYLGIVYLERGEARPAIAQLGLARDLQPADDEVHQRLLAAYDKLGDQAGALAALRASIAMSPQNLDLYAALAERLAAADDGEGAERAYTSLAEVVPNEAEGHRRLAKIRDNQRRFGDAVVQWQQVVRVRSDEPDGWLGLATSQIEARDFDGAQASIDHLLKTGWDARFKEVQGKARGLLRLLESRRG